MSDQAKTYWGVVAEFDSPGAIYRAANKTTEEGYSRVDSHTPMPGSAGGTPSRPSRSTASNAR